MIEAKGICFHYKNCPVVLQNVDFQAEDGHFLAILGNNGAGKSTLLKCMNGILKPDAGSLLLDGDPKDFSIYVRDIELYHGAGFITVLFGSILRMPGLPKHPNYEKIDLVDGEIVGLS